MAVPDGPAWEAAASPSAGLGSDAAAPQLAAAVAGSRGPVGCLEALVFLAVLPSLPPRCPAPFPGSSGPSRFLDQCSDKTQQLLMLGAMPAVHEEVADLNVCRLTAGGHIGLVLNEYPL